MSEAPQVHDNSGMIMSDVTSELWREYVFADNSIYRVTAPVTLYVKRKLHGDSHRVVDEKGVTHYIPSGWLVLRWKASPDAPEVSF